jgi:hypothetical protein
MQHRSGWDLCRRSPYMHPFNYTKNTTDGGSADEVAVHRTCVNIWFGEPFNKRSLWQVTFQALSEFFVLIV